MKTHATTKSNRHHVALAFRVVPVAILAIGMTLFAARLPTASAQYPANGGYQPPGQNPARTQTNGGYNVNQYGGNRSFQNSFPASSPPGGFSPSAASAPVARVAALPNASGGIPALPIDEAPAASAAEETPWETPQIVSRMISGGALMIPLALCCVIVICLSIERMIALRRSRVIPRPFVRRFTECVEDGQLSYDEATSICEEFDCPVAEVFRAAVRRWGRPMMEIEQAVMDAGDRVNDSLRRFVRVFHAISNVAPLLGLLGTVLGMIEAFEMMGSAESLGRPEMLASGISMALVTTAGGLLVAIPAYLAYMYFSAKSDRYLGEIDKLCTRVVDSISAEALESESKSRPRKRAA